MAATQIQEMRHPHDRVLDLILANPFWTLKQLSLSTGYTVPWLSQIIRSDCFRAEYDKRRDGVEAGIMVGITERLNALAHLAIDNMEEALLTSIDPEFKLDAFDKVLHRTGYAPGAKAGATPAQINNNVFLVERGELAQLRERIVGSGSTVEALPALAAPANAE